MTTVTTDRETIIHFAGFQHLSPALDEQSRPAFSSEPGERPRRCGWESFFAAMRACNLALEFEPEDATSARFVPASEARHPRSLGETLGGAIEHAQRFWKAYFSG
jgi:hypothetical protein